MRDLRDNDIVWIQDYHLMLLPGLLRQRLGARKGIKIGFSIHIPWPTYESYRILPVRKEILEGVLQSDLITLGTQDYVRYFLDNCSRLLNCHIIDSSVETDKRKVPVAYIPIGIHPQSLWDELESEQVRRKLTDLKNEFPGKIVLGIDRLEYTKGLPQKFLAFQKLLVRYPQWVGRATLIQVAVPSRTRNAEYQALRAEIENLATTVNDGFGTSLGLLLVNTNANNDNRHKQEASPLDSPFR